MLGLLPILSNGAMKPSKIIRHFHFKYSNYEDKPIDYFKQLLVEMNDQKKQMKTMKNEKEEVTRKSSSSPFRTMRRNKTFFERDKLLFKKIFVG